MGRQAFEGLAAAASALRSGALVGLPTETVYGLAADATNPRAVAAIYAAKDRPRFNPLIVHVASIEAALNLLDLGPLGEKLASAFWPGSLSLVGRRKPANAVVDIVTAGLDTIAVRVPAHPVALALLRSLPFPLAAPSANRSGRVSATRAEDIVSDLGDDVAVILDAGQSQIGLESTIVGIVDEPILLRLGAIPRQSLDDVIGRPLRLPALKGRPDAPGMLASHYAPSVPLRLDATGVESGESLLTFGPDVPPGAADAGAIVNLSSSSDLVEAAANFFAALRDLDKRGAPIAVMPIPDRGLGSAINDRLRRAAAPRNA